MKHKAKPVITDVNQVLKQRGQSWEIITNDLSLKGFLSEGGDYSFWVTARGRCHDILECGGGNAYHWSLVNKDTVHIKFQFGTKKELPCRIRLDVLWEAIERLAASRHLREKYLAAEQEYEVHHATWLASGQLPCKRCSDHHQVWEREKAARATFRAQDIPFQFV